MGETMFCIVAVILIGMNLCSLYAATKNIGYARTILEVELSKSKKQDKYDIIGYVTPFRVFMGFKFRYKLVELFGIAYHLWMLNFAISQGWFSVKLLFFISLAVQLFLTRADIILNILMVKIDVTKTHGAKQS